MFEHVVVARSTINTISYIFVSEQDIYNPHKVGFFWSNRSSPNIPFFSNLTSEISSQYQNANNSPEVGKDTNIWYLPIKNNTQYFNKEVL
jgi:hypothetical protein